MRGFLHPARNTLVNCKVPDDVFAHSVPIQIHYPKLIHSTKRTHAERNHRNWETTKQPFVRSSQHLSFSWDRPGPRDGHNIAQRPHVCVHFDGVSPFDERTGRKEPQVYSHIGAGVPRCVVLISASKYFTYPYAMVCVCGKVEILHI